VDSHRIINQTNQKDDPNDQRMFAFTYRRFNVLNDINELNGHNDLNDLNDNNDVNENINQTDEINQNLTSEDATREPFPNQLKKPEKRNYACLTPSAFPNHCRCDPGPSDS